MWRTKQVQDLFSRIPIRWRLTLISLGLLTLLLGVLGITIAFTAEQALIASESNALHNEARLATDGLKGHPFIVGRSPGPPPGPPTYNFKFEAAILAQKLDSTTTNAVILSPQGSIIVAYNNFPFTPASATVEPDRVRQFLESGQDSNSHLLVRDTQGKQQLVVLLPLISDHHTIAILQIGSPTASVDSFITTLRLILLLGVLCALCIATVLTFPLIGAALRPLVEMEQTSRRIAEGALSMRLHTPETDDEIGHLAQSFNQMVAQLEAAFRRQKQFVADVSHELRTPLTALSGSLEMLLIGADKGDVEASRRLTRGMYAEVQRMNRMVEDLLSLTRMDERKTVVREDNIQVRTILDKVYDQAQQLARGQEIHCTVEPQLPLVRADSDKLQQVLLNIVDNALKFTPKDGHVELVARSEGQATVIIEVRDTGKGIAAEALPLVFDRFYRADPSRTRLSSYPEHRIGSGLGLSIAKELMEAQDGSIAIDSVLGKGTTVTLRLRTAAIPNLINVVE